MKVVLYRILVVSVFVIILGVIYSVVKAPYPMLSQSDSVSHLDKDWNQLRHLLRERNLHPEKSRQIDATIDHYFAEIHAVMVLDLSGFSKTTEEEGIISALAMIQKMDDFVVDIIHQKSGTVIKFKADNVYAVFPTVEQGVAAAIEMIQKLEDTKIQVSMGIGYGKLLMLDGIELFGNELNLAAKLGEDIAQPQEILLTESAFNQLQFHSKNWKKFKQSLSGITLTFYKFIPNL